VARTDSKLRLRSKRQLTLPEAVAERLGLREGDEIMISIESPDHAVIRPVLKSYAGVLGGLFKDDAELNAFVEGERGAWGT